MRRTPFAEGEYYHIYGRGNRKQRLFLDRRDYARFLFLMLYLQTPTTVHNVSRAIKRYIKTGSFEHGSPTRTDARTGNKKNERDVLLAAFTIMPNHFHLIASERPGGNLSRYMHRVLTAYSMYFNTKYELTGHVFQGPFQAVHIASNEQLLYVSAYIHRNQREISRWRNNEHNYPYSSFWDYVNGSRWADFLDPTIVLAQFANGADYQHFVDTSGVKGMSDFTDQSPSL